jgi:hypothetical protein
MRKELPEGSRIVGFQERLNSCGASFMNFSPNDSKHLFFHKEEESEKN